MASEDGSEVAAGIFVLVITLLAGYVLGISTYHLWYTTEIPQIAVVKRVEIKDQEVEYYFNTIDKVRFTIHQDTVDLNITPGDSVYFQLTKK